MRKFSILLALVAGLFTSQAMAANFSAKDAAAATIIFTNPGNCTTGCTPIFAWSDSTGTNLVAVVTAGADAASNTATGGLVYGRNLVFNGTTWDRWTGAVTVSSGTITNLSQLGGQAVSMGTGVRAAGTQRVTIATDDVVPASQSGTWNVTNVSGTVSLPTGAATSALQTTGNTSLATIATNSALPLPAQAGIGNVNIGAVQSAGSKYIAVAASQTATVLQASAGAAGDYLSHCVIYPTSTSPGLVTVFDNTNTAATSAILFAGGATSTSNLTPISVPVGAVSTAGAWKVTTGTAVSVVCFGKFS